MQMKFVSIKKRIGIHVAGGPSQTVEKGPAVRSTVAAMPDKIPFIKPRLLVKKGDAVKIGTPLFEDKKNPKLRFLSPGGGTVAEIDYGHRRAITRIVIKTDKTEAHESFEPVDEKGLKNWTGTSLIETLMDRGLWPLIRSLPYRGIASPDEKPSSLWVSLDSADPFQVPSNRIPQRQGSPFPFRHPDS
jgi:Na+-transporting NADH:ubiquinone oxidoreductase subunit A